MPDLTVKTVPYYQSKPYRCWVRMIHRCHNENYEGYETYGGRGIKVCDRWRDSYQNFILDVGQPPSPDHSLDRKDNDKGYLCGKADCPTCSKAEQTVSNCRWVTIDVQANNRRTNVLLTHQGRSMTMAQWASFLGITRKLLWKRLNVLKWPLEKALTPKTLPPATHPRRQAA